MIEVTATCYRDLARPKPTAPYAVSSRLPRGQAVLRGPQASYKSVSDGEERYRFGGRTIGIRSGTAIILPPDTDLPVEIPSGAVGRCVYFPVKTLAARLGERASDELAAGDEADIHRNIPFGAPIPTLRLWRPNAQAESAEDLLDIFLASLADRLGHLARADANLPHKRAHARAEIARRLETARDFIHENPMIAFSLDDLARAARLSRYHFARCFRNAYGTPPLRYHQDIRLRAARARILAGEPLKKVADDFGFSDLSAFSRAYRRVHGAPPSRQK